MPGNRKAGMKNLRKVFARKAAALVGGRVGSSVDHGLEQQPQAVECEKIVPYISVAGTAPGHQFPNEVPSRVNIIGFRGNAANTTNASAIKCIQMHNNGVQNRAGNRTSMKLVGNLNKYIVSDTVGDVAVVGQNQINIKRPRLMQRDINAMNNQLRKTVRINHTGAKPYLCNCKSVQTTDSTVEQQIDSLNRVHNGEMKTVPRQKLKIDASTCISDTLDKISSMRSLRTPLQKTSSSLARQLQKSSLYPSVWSMGNPTKLEKQESHTSLDKIPMLRRAGRYKSPANRPTNLDVETSSVKSRSGKIINTDDIISLLSGKEKKIKAVQKKKVGAKVLKRHLPPDADLDAKIEWLIKLASSTKRKRMKKTTRRCLHQIKRERLKSDFSNQLKPSSSSSSLLSFNVGGQECCYSSDEQTSEQSYDNNNSDDKVSLKNYKTGNSCNHKVELECDKIVVCCCKSSSNKQRLRIECCNKSQENEIQVKTKRTKDQNSELRNSQNNRNSMKTRLQDEDVQDYKNRTSRRQTSESAKNGSEMIDRSDHYSKRRSSPQSEEGYKTRLQDEDVQNYKNRTSRRQTSESAKDGSEMIDRSDHYSKRRSFAQSEEGYNDNRGSIQNKNRSKQNSLVTSNRRQQVPVNDDYSDNDRYDNHTQNFVFNNNSEQPDCQTQSKYPSSWKMCCVPEMLPHSLCCPYTKLAEKEKYSKPKMSGTELMFDKSDLRMTNIERISLPPGLNSHGDSRRKSSSKNNDSFQNNRGHFDVESRRNPTKNTMDRNERSSKGAVTYENYSRAKTNGFEDTRKNGRYSENNWKDERSRQLCDSCCDLNACLCNCPCPVSNFNYNFNNQEYGWGRPYSQQQQQQQQQQHNHQNGDLCCECNDYCNCLYTDINGYQRTSTSPSNRNESDSRKDRLRNVCDLCCDCCDCCDFGKNNKGYKQSNDKEETPRSHPHKKEQKNVDRTSEKLYKPKPYSSKPIDNTPRSSKKTIPNRSIEITKPKSFRKSNEDSPSSTNRVSDEMTQKHIDRQKKQNNKIVERDLYKRSSDKNDRNSHVENHRTTPRSSGAYKYNEQPRSSGAYKNNEEPRSSVAYKNNEQPRSSGAYKNNEEPRSSVAYKNNEQPRSSVPRTKNVQPRITEPHKNNEEPKRNNIQKMNENPPRSKNRVPNKPPQKRSEIKNDESEQSNYEKVPKRMLSTSKDPPKRPQKPDKHTMSNKPFEEQKVTETKKPRTVDNDQKTECCNPSNCVYKHSTSNYSLSGPTTDYKSSRGSVDSDKENNNKLESRNSFKRVENPYDCDDTTCERKNTGRTQQAKNLKGGSSKYFSKGIPRDSNDVQIIYNSSSKFSRAEKSSNASTLSGEKRLQDSKIPSEDNISLSGPLTSGQGNEKSLKENISIRKCCDNIDYVDLKPSDSDVKSSKGEISICSGKSGICFAKRNQAGYSDCQNSIDLSINRSSEQKFYRLARTSN